MALNGTDCAGYIDFEMHQVRKGTVGIISEYTESVSAWEEAQKQYLEDMEKYLAGELAEPPQDPGAAPAMPAMDGFPSSADYNKAFGDGFFAYLCENTSVEFDWKGSGYNVNSKENESEEFSFTVKGFTTAEPGEDFGGFFVKPVVVASGFISGGGALATPDSFPDFLKKIFDIVETISVTLAPAGGVWAAPTAPFEPPEKHDFSNVSFPSKDGDAVYQDFLVTFCDFLLDTFKQKHKFQGSYTHISSASVPAGYSGTLKMVSIS